MCTSTQSQKEHERTPPENTSEGQEEDDLCKCDQTLHPALPLQQQQQPQQEQQARPPNALESASIFSRVFFIWPYRLLQLGLQRPLEELDLPQVMPKDSSVVNRDHLQKIWQEEVAAAADRSRRRGRPCRPSLHRALLRDFLRSVWYVQPMMMVGATAKVVQALVLGYLIDSFHHEGQGNGYLWASLLVLCGLIVLFEHHHVFFFTWRKGMQIRVACVAAIYDKSLKLSSTHQETVTSYGRIMNLASNDVERFLMASLFLNYLFWAPLQAMAILAVGCVLFGKAFAAGFALLVAVFVPLQFYLSQRFAHYRSKIAAITDKRVTFVSQAVRGARVVKMSGYEHRFLDRIQEYRRQETAQISQANSLKAWNEALFFSTNVVVSLVIFFVHVALLGGSLAPGDVFTVFTLVNILQLEMTKHVSLGVMGVSECYVSISRIQAFLDFPELSSSSSCCEQQSQERSEELPRLTSEENKKIAIVFSNIKCYWNQVKQASKAVDQESSSSTSFLQVALDSVSVEFAMGQVTAIVGTVGSGKSALLQAVVQELPIVSGHVTRDYTTIAYAAQDPWIMDGTVKENIIMGLELDQAWYDRVIQACGLALDFQLWRDGDQTIVGDRGVQCSGGQRARIGLARAIYRDSEVLVLDDPLSAVDAKVGRQLYQDAIVGLGVNQGKCVILATHQHQYINDCKCILMVSGRVGCIGTYDECVSASNGKLTAHAADDTVDNLDYELDPHSKTNEAQGNSDSMNEKLEGGENDHKEMNVTGLVRFETYMAYVRAMGGTWVGYFLLLLFSLTQASVVITVATLGRWAQKDVSRQDDWDVMGRALGLGGSVVALAIVRALVSFRFFVKASRQLHNRMATAVLRAKIEFFDTNPLGRILNRFSADVGICDDLLPNTLFDFTMIAFMVLGAIIATIITMPFTLVALPPLMWYFVSVRSIFVTSTRELKRLEGLARSPIFAMLSESLGGISTIRANDCIEFFKEKFKLAHDAHTRAFFSFIAASRWVGFRMDSIMFLFLALVSFLSVLFNTQGWFSVDPAIFGVALSMLLQLAGIFQWCIRQSAEVVNYMISVERILAFGQLEPEAPLSLPEDKDALQDWPSKGALDVQELSVRYRPSLPLALDKVSFRVPAGSRVGIVGRTGSGKSTIVQALFRLLEPENGCIVIDGVDITKIGLHACRTAISVIPQVPTLFSGCSVRENLDLFELHSDESIRSVLDACHMSQVVDEMPQGWNSVVAEGGSNFSVGQRQLLCLARAILNRSKILVLDEATASVDRRTDQLLQQALQESFHDGTILAVAHRLDTVIENDYILVLGGGRVLEFDSPAALIRTGGAFASMVADTGEKMSQELRQRAFAKEKLKVVA